MEVLATVAVVVLVLAVGFALQVGLLMLASSLTADTPVGAGQAAVVVLVASVVNAIIQVAMALGGAGMLGSPMALLVWGGVLSTVCGMRIGQAVFTAIAMSILQGLMAFGLLAAVAAASMAG